MTVVADQLGPRFDDRNYGWLGNGYFAGEAADPGDPDSPDGLARILNVPTRVKICVYERKSMQIIASVLSAADGTWRIEWLNPDVWYTVIGFDNAGTVNAAIQDWVKPAPM